MVQDLDNRTATREKMNEGGFFSGLLGSKNSLPLVVSIPQIDQNLRQTKSVETNKLVHLPGTLAASGCPVHHFFGITMSLPGPAFPALSHVILGRLFGRRIDETSPVRGSNRAMILRIASPHSTGPYQVRVLQAYPRRQLRQSPPYRPSTDPSAVDVDDPGAGRGGAPVAAHSVTYTL